jgi:hypothetical protein
MGGQDVSEVQERHLEEFTSGLTIAQRLHGLPGPASAAQEGQKAGGVPAAPEAIIMRPRTAFWPKGRSVAEQQAKRDRHPQDALDELPEQQRRLLHQVLRSRARPGRLPVPVASAERHRELHYLSK